ncbi:hypothetical protein [Streptomyces sp. JH34]|uniref:hypothetical protein n=1 Tax=Streptomyces sp. JH34 TaxID=2793633 RepID=UPI0023F697A7|nr:hypothetical protein [Streptomyces sp. JH34]MDF6022626.1 hypothetical protein [Streptomyces sp. JH34]
MNLRTVSLALVVLLSTAGCVSVRSEARKPEPAVSGHPGNTPAVQASTPPAAPPAVHDALGKAEEAAERTGGKKRRKGAGAGGPAGPAAVVAPPPRAEARNQPRRAMPVRPQPPRRAHVPRPPRPRHTYDMRSVCATGRGVASAEVVDLCRTTYGR